MSNWKLRWSWSCW